MPEASPSTHGIPAGEAEASRASREAVSGAQGETLIGPEGVRYTPEPLPEVPPPPPDVDPHRDRYTELNLARLKEQGFVTADASRNPVSEEFRMIKRPLLANAFGQGADLVRNGNLVMVTSARSGEGKTFTAINLAISIAMEMDKTVLLVDADVGRSRVHEILGTPMGPGLIDLLLDRDLDVGDVMIKTNIPKLRVIPMGRYHPHSNELLASRDMERLAQELAQRYPDRMVIFDSPPLLLTSEAVVLAGLLGQIVFVVESSRTLQGAVKDALSMLDTSKPIGLVLNKMRNPFGGRYAGYGYGYGYGYHYHHDEPAAQGPAA
ncbi:exopolysaccharide/PEP-CTERM locus tyrosine autokinase [Ectothiorhodospira mobilis]|uniref:Exopolysaccharide/PEP-CTERM locus tyrosine autokinase n=1 Tax=Ectothiorhodospira mobilis TaxID=195064 RepID=A0A1I4P8W6_ECTMO|nr:exopolysaccharide/PEP-CTERM locus tyrosine autokinase [Ectothiorhodospira mobilis]